MIQVLRVLGFRLIVEVRREVAHRHERSVPVGGAKHRAKAGCSDCSSVHSRIQN